MSSSKGTGEYGRIYEQKTAALFAIRCALDQNVADFWLLSNLTRFGALDDIVFHVENRDGSKKLYCMQLKHVANGSLQLRQLTANGGEFSLQKYSDSYETIMNNTVDSEFLNQPDLDRSIFVHFILYTNLPFKGKNVSDSIELLKEDPVGLFCTSKTLDNTFSVKNSSNSKNPFNQSFLQQFSLYTKQVSASALDRFIKNELESHFTDVGDNVIIYITDFFAQWALNKEKKDNKLFKGDIQMKLVEYLLQPHIIEPRNILVGNVSTVALLNDTLIKFNVTPIVYKESLEYISSSIRTTLQQICDIQFSFETSWNASLTDDQYAVLQSSNSEKIQQILNVLEERIYYVPDLTVKDLYLSAWQCNLIPLIINSNSSQDLIKQLFVKLKHVLVSLSIVLLTSQGAEDIDTSLKMFNNFCDISDDNLINRNLDNIHVSLQGKPALSLREFKDSIDVLTEITPDVYVTLLNETMKIGEVHEIENYYIKRAIQAPRISYEVFAKSNLIRERAQRHVFLMVKFERCENFLSHLYRNNMVDLMMFIQNYSSGVSEEKYILTSSLSQTDEKLTQAIEYLHTEMNIAAIHVVEQRRDHLLWLSSKGPVDILYEHIYDPKEELTDNQIDEDEVLGNFLSDIHIISNNAGMGKTLMLRSLANKYPSNAWVCCINLSEHMSRTSQIKETDVYVNYLTEQQVEANNETVKHFCRKIFVNRCQTGNSVWLLDGYDEVPSDVFPFLSFLKGWKNKVWITTRSTYKRELEMYVNTLSLEIAPFRDIDLETFVWKYFASFHDIYSFNEEEVQKIVNKIREYATGIDKTLLAIPLQTRMLTEIIGDDISLTEKENLTIVELYDKFVDVKLKEYKAYEAVVLRRTLSQLALKLFYTEEQLEDLLDLVDLAEEAQAFRKSYKKDSIVIGLNKKGDAVFGHRSFAEYLAAQWLTKQIVTKKGFFAENWRPLVEQLFNLDMIPIRAFFDRLLCRNLPLHLAVLNNDTDKVKSILNDKITYPHIDVLGRSPLHLAASYGTYYDVYTSRESQEIYEMVYDFVSGHTLKPPVKKTQYQISTSVIEILIQNRYLNTFDALFCNDIFDYATKSCSLDALDCLYKTMEKENLLFLSGFDFRKFLYCIVCDNLHNVLSSRKEYNFTSPCQVMHKIRSMFLGDFANFFKMKYHQSYLTEIAAYTGSMEVLFELIQSQILTVDDGDPIHKACCAGQSNVVELLFKMGADVQKQDIKYDASHVEQRNPFYTVPMIEDMKLKASIHYASQLGHLECIKKLTHFGASVLTKDANGYNPLYYSTLYGHINCVLLMLDTLTEEEKRNEHSVHSVLNVAAARGYSTEQLVNYGLNVNNIDADGNTPVILASKNGLPTIIEELWKGPNCDLNLMKTNESIWSIRRWPIQKSVEIQQRETQNTYLSFFDMNLKLFCPQTGKDEVHYGGMAAIHFAILRGRVECVRTLIRLGADKNIEDTIGLGYSPIVWAAITGHDEIVEILLTDSCPDFSEKELEDIELALIWASILGYNSCVSILLRVNDEKLNNLESSRKKNRLEPILKRELAPYYDKIEELFGPVKNIPLVLAVVNNRLNVVENLLTVRYKENRDLNVALFWVSKEGYLESMKLLIAAGADVTLKTSGTEKMLPLTWASMNGQTEVVKFLLRDISTEYLTSYDVDLAVKYAAAGNHRECAEVLIEFDVDRGDDSNELGVCSNALIKANTRENLIKTKNQLLWMNCDLLLRTSERNVRYNSIGKKLFNIHKKLSAMGVYQYGTPDKTEKFARLQKSLDRVVANNENELLYKFTELGETKRDTD